MLTIQQISRDRRCELTSSVLIFILIWMNKSHEKRRVALGKPAKMVNSSMDAKYKADDQVGQDGRMLGEQAFSDLTDKQNDEVSNMRHDFFVSHLVATVSSTALFSVGSMSDEQFVYSY
jgi:hypothetical protein